MAFKSKYKGSEIEEIFDKVSTGKVGGGIKIVGSVDELDPEAPVGTMACVASETEIEVVKSFADAYQPTEDDKQSDLSVIKEKLTQITNVHINEDLPSDWWDSFDYDTIYIMNDTQNLGLQIYRNENHIQFDLSDLSLGDFIQAGTLALGTWDNDSNYTGTTLYQNSLDQLNNILSNDVFYYTGSSYNSAFLSRIYYKEDPIIDATTQLYIKKSTWEPFKTGGMTVVDSYDKLDPEAAVGEMATVFVPEVRGEKSIKDLVPGDVVTELTAAGNWEYENSFEIVFTNPQGQNVTIEWQVDWDDSKFLYLQTPEKSFLMAEYGEIVEWNEAMNYIALNPLTFVSSSGDLTDVDSLMTVDTLAVGGTELYYKKEKSWTSVAVDITGLGNVMTVDSVKKLPMNAPNGSIASVGIPSTLKEDVIENISQGTRISKIGVSPASQSLSYFEVLLHDESGNAMQITWDSGEQTIHVIYNGEYYYVLEYNEIIDSYITDVTKLLTDKVFTFQRITSGSASDINHVLKFTSGSEGSAELYYKNNGWKKLSMDLSTSAHTGHDNAVIIPKEYLQLVDYQNSTIRLSNPDHLAMPEYLFEIRCDNSAPSGLNFYPESGWDQINVLWANEDAPVFEVGYTYVISIMNNMAVYASFKH